VSHTGEEKRDTIDESHRRFAADLFNLTWDLLDKEDRSAKEDERMVHAAHASRFHWGEIGEPLNLAVGEWQIARVHATLDQPQAALRHAMRALEIIEENGISGFHRASAYEGVARAYSTAGDPSEARRYILLARQEGEKITDEEEGEVLLSQLGEIPEFEE
jgi:tetratricopeptide (TPR) repeat protein